ncbi:MAG TPA: hypothetical protein VL866_16115 [Pyrinomonadaceae bacterium]|nr:hypothetical protein [Pyrinomonadaceae bacterium]
MTPSDKSATTKNESRTLIIVVAIIAAVIIAVLFYFLMRATGGGTVAPPTLAGAIRPGSPEFEQYHSKIMLDEPEATEGRRALGDIVMTLTTIVRNFSGKTLSGIEIRGAVIDHQNQPLKQRTVVVLPSAAQGVSELAPNKTLQVQVVLDGMTETDDRANIHMEITGFRFKN